MGVPICQNSLFCIKDIKISTSTQVVGDTVFFLFDKIKSLHIRKAFTQSTSSLQAFFMGVTSILFRKIKGDACILK